jgi:hypothetical protein
LKFTSKVNPTCQNNGSLLLEFVSK